MRLIIFICSVLIHAVCSLSVYFLAPDFFGDTYAAVPVFLGLMGYFGWRLTQCAAHEYARFRSLSLLAFFFSGCAALSAFLPLVALVLSEWAASQLPRGVGEVLVTGVWAKVGITVCFVLAMVNVCLLVSIYRNKRESMVRQNDTREIQWLHIGGLRVSAAFLLWLNAALILVFAAAMAITVVWYKVSMDGMRKDLLRQAAFSDMAVSHLSLRLAQSDYESGNLRLFTLEDTAVEGESEPDGDRSLSVSRLVWSGDEATGAALVRRFVADYNRKMRELVSARAANE
ncbi:MAG: hypothetical protein KF886_17985 [Candidatus Hydrogenedentes bacterium]|nr:hypothetical protein [Candidatus Hydrogenedentota bacterium]